MMFTGLGGNSARTRHSGFPGEFYQVLKEALLPVSPTLLQKVGDQGALPNLFLKA